MKQALIAGAALLLVFSSSFAQLAPDAGVPATTAPLPDSAVLAERGGQVLTMGDMRAKLRNALPADKRRGFFSDGGRVAPLIDDLLGTRQVAAVARQNGLDKDPEIRAEVEMFELELLSRRQIQRHMAQLEEPDYEVLARERYLANRASYALPELRDVRHILIRLPAEGRSDHDALALAEKAREQLLAGADFDAVYDEYAEDSNTELKGWVRDASYEGRLDPAFSEVAFRLKDAGDVSEAVRTSFGYHVIRLEEIKSGRERSYDEVKDELVATIRSEFRMAARTTYVESFTSQPLKFNEENMQQLPTQE